MSRRRVDSLFRNKLLEVVTLKSTAWSSWIERSISSHHSASNRTTRASSTRHSRSSQDIPASPTKSSTRRRQLLKSVIPKKKWPFAWLTNAISSSKRWEIWVSAPLVAWLHGNYRRSKIWSTRRKLRCLSKKWLIIWPTLKRWISLSQSNSSIHTSTSPWRSKSVRRISTTNSVSEWSIPSSADAMWRKSWRRSRPKWSASTICIQSCAWWPFYQRLIVDLSRLNSINWDAHSSCATATRRLPPSWTSKTQGCWRSATENLTGIRSRQ